MIRELSAIFQEECRNLKKIESEKQSLIKEISDWFFSLLLEEQQQDLDLLESTLTPIKKLGLDIGSGAIESTHRTLVQSRMKQTGMYWKKRNIQSIASIEARVLSGKWNEMIGKHLKKAS